MGSSVRGLALAVTGDAELAGWLSDALPGVMTRPVQPDDDPAEDDADLGAPTIAIIDDACLGCGAGENALSRWLAACPILVLVRRRDPARVASLLDAGADDAMCAPYDSRELRARVAALLRRGARRWELLAPTGMWYDRLRREILDHDGAKRRLTRSEAVVIESLLEASGSTVTREALLHRLAMQPLAVKSNVVDRHVATLRAKLGDDHRRPRFVATVAGEGYRLQTGG
jgi:DNA-binding response OmpR family regulator